MRDIFEDIFAAEPDDPVTASRRNMRPALRKRFYEDVTVEKGEGGYVLHLDGRPVRTPRHRPLAAPANALGGALAAEWRGQREFIDPAAMPLTRLGNSIIDAVAETPAPVAAEVEKYLGSDLVFYRAESPEGLIAAQSAAWDPVLDWAREALGARFICSAGLVFVEQPEIALKAAAATIPRDPDKGREMWRLGALSVITTLTGSALIALAVLHRRLSAEQAWDAGHVDEDWNMKTWGRDEQAVARRAARFAEMQAAATVLEALRD
jgi:chaperone required for assembly of F1-ATPase